MTPASRHRVDRRHPPTQSSPDTEQPDNQETDMDVSWTSHTVDINGDVHYIDFGGPAQAAGDRPRHARSCWSTASAARTSTGSSSGRCWPRTPASSPWTCPDSACPSRPAAAARSTANAARARPVPARGRRRSGDPRRQLDGRHDLDDPGASRTRRRSPGWCCSIRCCHAPRAHRSIGRSPRQFVRYAIPGVGERFLARHRATTPVRQTVTDSLTQCCVDPDTGAGRRVRRVGRAGRAAAERGRHRSRVPAGGPVAAAVRGARPVATRR